MPRLEGMVLLQALATRMFPWLELSVGFEAVVGIVKRLKVASWAGEEAKGQTKAKGTGVTALP